MKSKTTQSSEPIRVLVGERSRMGAEALGVLLERMEDVAVVDVLVGAPELIAASREKHPDVVTIDSQLPQLPTAEIVRQLTESEAPPNCLVLLENEQDQDLGTVIQAGAVGIVTRDATSEDLFEAIRRTAQGRRNMCSSVQQRVIAGFTGVDDPASEAMSPLTDRERTVLKLTAEGHSFSAIGRHLGISARTAETHRSNLARKLGLSTQTEIVRFAIRHGVIEA